MEMRFTVLYNRLNVYKKRFHITNPHLCKKVLTFSGKVFLHHVACANEVNARRPSPQHNLHHRSIKMELLQLLALIHLFPGSLSRVTVPEDYDKYIGSKSGKS